MKTVNVKSHLWGTNVSKAKSMSTVLPWRRYCGSWIIFSSFFLSDFIWSVWVPKTHHKISSYCYIGRCHHSEQLCKNKNNFIWREYREVSCTIKHIFGSKLIEKLEIKYSNLLCFSFSTNLSSRELFKYLNVKVYCFLSSEYNCIATVNVIKCMLHSLYLGNWNVFALFYCYKQHIFTCKNLNSKIPRCHLFNVLYANSKTCCYFF